MRKTKMESFKFCWRSWMFQLQVTESLNDISEASWAPKEQHLEETVVYKDIGLGGREDVPQPGLSLWILAF